MAARRATRAARATTATRATKARREEKEKVKEARRASALWMKARGQKTIQEATIGCGTTTTATTGMVRKKERSRRMKTRSISPHWNSSAATDWIFRVWRSTVWSKMRLGVEEGQQLED